jgi:hypothetical protein
MLEGAGHVAHRSQHIADAGVAGYERPASEHCDYHHRAAGDDGAHATSADLADEAARTNTLLTDVQWNRAADRPIDLTIPTRHDRRTTPGVSVHNGRV